MIFWSKRRSAEATTSPEAVWIVRHDESPHGTVLGVFATESEASAFAEEAMNEFAAGVIYSRFSLGYKFNRGPGYVTYGPDEHN